MLDEIDLDTALEGINVFNCHSCRNPLNVDDGVIYHDCNHAYCLQCHERQKSCVCHPNGVPYRIKDLPRGARRFELLKILKSGNFDSYQEQPIPNGEQVDESGGMSCEPPSPEKPSHGDENMSFEQNGTCSPGEPSHVDEEMPCEPNVTCSPEEPSHGNENKPCMNGIPNEEPASSPPPQAPAPIAENKRLQAIKENLMHISSEMAKIRVYEDFSQFAAVFFSNFQKEKTFHFYKMPKSTQRNLLEKFLHYFSFKKESVPVFEASAVIVSHDANFDVPDWPLICAGLRGLPIISSQWCEDSLNRDELLPFEDYTVQPSCLPGLKKAQQIFEENKPGLFTGFLFVMPQSDRFRSITYRVSCKMFNVRVCVADLPSFVTMAGGIIINNKSEKSSCPTCYYPVPRALADIRIIELTFDNTSVFNQYSCVLPVSWLVECILKCELIEPDQL